MIACFFGIDHKVGTTMITQSVADAIAHNDPTLNVVRLSLHNRDGLDFYPHPVGFIDDLLHKLEGKSLRPDELETASHQSGSLRVLGGLHDISLGRRFGVEETKYLLEFVQESSDIIIVDAGSEIDSGLAAGALSSCDQMFYIGTQSESCLRRFPQVDPMIKYCCPVGPTAFILNKFFPNEVYNMPYISKRLGIKSESFLPIMAAENYLKAERDKKSFYGRLNKKYDSDILTIADLVTDKKGIGALKRKNKGLKQMLGLSGIER